MSRVFIRMIETGRDSAINYIISSFNSKYLLAYQIITANYLDWRDDQYLIDWIKEKLI